MDPATGRGKQLMTMLTEVNFFVDPPVTSSFIGLCDFQFTQNGPFEVIGSLVGTTFGNLPGYEAGLKTTDQFRLVRRGQNETMLGYPIRNLTALPRAYRGRAVLSIGPAYRSNPA
jgi:hypothetical protein